MIRLRDLTPRELEMLETLFAGIEGAIIIDEEGIVRVYTEHYERESGLKRETVIGRRIEEVFPGTRMLEVVKTGKPIIAELWELNGKSRFVSRIPIISDGQVIGAVGFSLFRYQKEAEEFADRLRKTFSELKYYKQQVRELSGARYSVASIIGESEGIREAKERIKMISASNIPVLIIGDTGTGKELVAHAIHQESTRHDGPFVRVNCAGIPDTLIESELFGYEEGAFTGARKGGKPGKFELADRGSLFLDEISDLSRTAQAKLLRALQENEIERVGSTRLVPVDVRIISATNVPLNPLVAQGVFRKDLLFRLNVFTIYLPPLRERVEDIPLLCQHFIEVHNRENGTHIEGVTPEAYDLLTSYHWPGNIREFYTVMERACIDTQEGMISNHNLLRFTGIAKSKFAKAYGYAGFDLKAARREAEKATILRALQASEGNRLAAAKLLNISRSALYTKMAELGITE
ncbi:MAG: sigma-54 interaction domain-containing protein [Solirubrobacterales bacterium]